MIIANITSFYGLCSDAEHYYCNFYNLPKDVKIEERFVKYYSEMPGGLDKEQLERKITSQKEAKYLSEKERGRIRVGDETGKFNSVSQVHNKLLKLFPKETIITYNEKEMFSEMLVYINGEDKGYKYFGETWSPTPTSCYKDLLPPLDEVKIKCECGHEYKLEEVVTERELDDRPWIKFKRRREMENTHCCQDFYLEWNVVL